MQGPAEGPRPAECPAPCIGVGGGLLFQLLRFALPQYPPVKRPIEQLAISANLFVADHFEAVPRNGVDEVEAEAVRQVTFNSVFEG